MSKSSKRKLDLDGKIALCQDYTQTWAKFFNFFGDGFEGRRVTADGETQFFRIMTDLARREYRLTYFLQDDFKMGKDILDVLSDAISLAHIQEMSEAQFSKYQLQWHVIFIALNKALGRLIERQPLPKETKKKPAKAAKAKAPQKPAKAAKAPPPSKPAPPPAG